MIFSHHIKRDRIKIFISIIFIFLMPTSLLANEFKVTEIYDGHTIRVKGYGVELKVRLAGIDAPEIAKNKIGFRQRFSLEARDYLSDLILNKGIEIKSHGYLNIDMMLGTVFLDDININLEMVRAGMAEVYSGEPPKDLNLDPFFKAEIQSRAEKKGIWTQGDNYVSPRTWRKRQRLKSACAIILFGICEKGEK